MNETILTTDITPERKRAAAERAEKIRNNIRQAAHEYAMAVAEKDWEALGYRDVREWADAELGPVRWTPQARQEIGELLTGVGFTYRQMARVLDVSPATVAVDLAGVRNLNTTAGSERQQAARGRERRRRGITWTDEPTVQLEIPAPAATVAAWDLATAIGHVAQFAGKHEEAVLRCIHLVAGEGTLRVEATDRYAAAVESIRCDCTARLDLVLPADTALKVAEAFQACSRMDDQAGIAAGDACLIITVSGQMFTIPRCREEWQFPPVADLAIAPEQTATVAARHLAKVARVAGNDGEIVVRFTGPGKPAFFDIGNFRAAVMPNTPTGLRDLRCGGTGRGTATA